MDAALATNQTLKAYDGSGTDKDGASLTLAGGRNTGGGLGGAIIGKTSLYDSGTTPGSYSTRAYAYAGQKAMTDSVDAGLCDITLPTGKFIGVDLFVTIAANDGFGGWSVTTTKMTISAYNDGGAITHAESTMNQSNAQSGPGTQTVSFYGDDAGSGVLRIYGYFTSDGWSEPPSNIRARWQIWINSDDAATVTPL